MHIDDACDAITKFTSYISDKQINSGVYNISTGIGTTVKQFSEIVLDVMHGNSELLQFGQIDFREDDTSFVVGDPALFRTRCHWMHKYDLRSGIAQSIKEYLQNVEVA